MTDPKPVVFTMYAFVGREGMRLEVATNPGGPGMPPFPVLRIGPVVIHPDRELLRDLRDKIDAYLREDLGSTVRPEADLHGTGTVRPWYENT